MLQVRAGLLGMVLKRNYGMLRWHQAGRRALGRHQRSPLDARYTAHDPRVWVSQRLCVSISPPRALRLACGECGVRPEVGPP